MKKCLIALAVLLCGVAQGEARVDWIATVYDDDRHNAFTDLIEWKGMYYVCFRHGESHGSMDGEIRVMRSADLKTWEPCGTLKTWGDDRDPKFVVKDETLYVYFGTWNLKHGEGHALPDRDSVRSYFATTTDGTTWSKIQGVYEPGWWLWRIREHGGALWSAAYTATRPTPDFRETRLLRSEDGLNWELVSVVTREHMAGEADLLFPEDGSIRLFSRTGDKPGTSYWMQSDPSMKEWTLKDSGVLVHAPVFARWKDRLFVAGRATGTDGSVTKIWEAKGDELIELITLPSGGDTSYCGLLADPASLEGETPALFVTWYSQHERGENKNEASVYAARVVVE